MHRLVYSLITDPAFQAVSEVDTDNGIGTYFKGTKKKNSNCQHLLRTLNNTLYLITCLFGICMGIQMPKWHVFLFIFKISVLLSAGRWIWLPFGQSQVSHFSSARKQQFYPESQTIPHITISKMINCGIKMTGLMKWYLFACLFKKLCTEFVCMLTLNIKSPFFLWKEDNHNISIVCVKCIQIIGL